MAFCPKCESEFRPGFFRCEECETELVENLPEKEPVPSPALVAVYETTRLEDALAVSAVLDGNGIPATVENEHVSQWMFGMSTSAFPLRINVPKKDASDALVVLRELHAKPPPAPARPTARNRKWLIALALLIPGMTAGGMYLGGSVSFACAGAWAVLALGLILDLRDRRPGRALSEGKIAGFFLLGSASAVALILLSLPWERLASHMTPAQLAFLYIGPIEELAKLLPVLGLVALLERRDRFAWVLAAAASGAGFGLVENIFKFNVYANPESALIITLAGLGHAVWSGLAGYAIARFGIVGALLGWLLASLLHGAWDALACEKLEWICLGGLGIAAWAYFKNIDRWIEDSQLGPALDSPAA